MADAPTTPTPRDGREEGLTSAPGNPFAEADASTTASPAPSSESSAADASREADDEPTPGVSVDLGSSSPAKPGRYAGSPFHQSRYQGIQDAISWQDENRRRERKRERFRQSTITVMLVIGALLGGVTGGSFAVWSLTSDGLVQAGQYSPPTISVTNPDDATPITAVAATALPSVVTLQVQGGGAGGSGSGVIISEDGYIVTNAHVVTVGGQTTDPRIRVTTTDGKLMMAEVVGTDPVSDIAVIKVDSLQPFVPIRIGDSSRMNVGDQTVAIGAPLGLSNTVTLGIVSALNRSITVGESSPEDGPGLFDFDLPGGQTLSAGVSIPVIQTDASINPGNSGGALLNADGELIGINVAIASNTATSQSAGSIGLGFAIPVNYALRVAEELIESGLASHGLLGATVTDAAFDEAATISGAYIDSVVPGGPADQIGLRAGDVVTSFNKLPITNRIDLTAQVRTLPGGSTAPITYVRGGQTYTSQVTLAELGSG